jgi:hypothetical protein
VPKTARKTATMPDKLTIAIIIGFASAVGSAALAVAYMLAKLCSAAPIDL